MINDLIRQTIIPALAETNYYGRLTGITRVLNVQTESGQNQSFPVTCNTRAKDVYTNGDYRQFVPDSSVQSIGFFENTSYQLRDGDHPHRKRASYLVRFLAWYNLDRMGIQDCEIPFAVINATIEALTVRVSNTPFNSALSVSVPTLIQDNNHQAAFSKYSFAREDGMFMYPYAFAAFDVNVVIDFNPSCIPAVPDTANCNCQIY